MLFLLTLNYIKHLINPFMINALLYSLIFFDGGYELLHFTEKDTLQECLSHRLASINQV
mgnify:CR=1 FL=1|jgi:hypothetical protein